MSTELSSTPIKRPGFPRRVGTFGLKVMRDFQRNQGLLLAGAVAYYTLLSIVPLLALILVGLSHFVKEDQLIQTIARNLELLVPGYADSLANHVRTFLARRHLVGAVGFIVMLFFSSMAFSMLESTMMIIFSHRQRSLRRPLFISVIIPYFYILLVGLGFFVITIISGALDALDQKHVLLLGYELSLAGSSKILLYLLGMLGMILMLTSLYLVMPVGHISLRHALSGAITAAVLWEMIRRILVWYYSKLSLVNVIYGSLATTVVALLSIEVAVIILLLGAQVISEFDRRQYEPQVGGKSAPPWTPA